MIPTALEALKEQIESELNELLLTTGGPLFAQAKAQFLERAAGLLTAVVSSPESDLPEKANLSDVGKSGEGHCCAGCHHRWDGELKGAELCGDCWRKAQPVVHGAVVSSPESALSNEDRLFAANAILGFLQMGVCPRGFDRDDLREFSERLVKERSGAVVSPPESALCPVCHEDGIKTRLHKGACWKHGSHLEAYGGAVVSSPESEERDSDARFRWDDTKQAIVPNERAVVSPSGRAQEALERLVKAVEQWEANDSETAYYDEKELRDAAYIYVIALRRISAPPSREGEP